MIEQVTSLEEVETYYDLVDVLDANEALDLKEDAEHQATESLKQSAKSGKRR